MAKYWETSHVHNYSWNEVASCYWSRYPNPNSKHVFSEDMLDVKVVNGRLHTKRLIIKSNKLPSWGEHLFKARRVALIEESIVDPINKTFVTYTRNIGLRIFMGVTERVTFRQLDEKTAAAAADKQVWIESDIYGLRSAIKKFGVDRFKKNCVAATQGFEWVMQKRFNNNTNNNAQKKVTFEPLNVSNQNDLKQFLNAPETVTN